METVKKFTQLIPEESDEDEDEPKPDEAAEAEPVQEGGDGTPEDASADKAEVSKSKDKSKGTPSAPPAEPKKGGKKGKEVVAAVVEVEDPNKKPDLNFEKVIPGIVNLKRENVSSIYSA